MKDTPQDLAKIICHDVGEALLRRYGDFRGQHLKDIAEYYAFIREIVERILIEQSV